MTDPPFPLSFILYGDGFFILVPVLVDNSRTGVSVSTFHHFPIRNLSLPDPKIHSQDSDQSA